MNSRQKSRDPPSLENSPVKKKTAKNIDLSRLAPTSSNQPPLSMAGTPAGPGPGASSTAPQWFVEFEHRQEARFAELLQAQQLLRFDVDNAIDDIGKLKTALEQANAKIDDLENRSRRNNVVIWGAPEGSEKGARDCVQFVEDLLADAVGPGAVQRAHRSGRPPSAADNGRGKPRPIHVGFASYREKEAARRKLIEVFKEKPEGVKMFVADDYSKRIQQMRRDNLPKLKELRARGIKAFFVYPATIRIRDANGRLTSPQS